MTSVAGPRAAVPRDTSREENYEPNTEEEVELHHRAGLTSPVRQACRGLYEKEEKVDDNNCGYLPVANTICRRSARVKCPLACISAATATTASIAATSSLPSPSLAMKSVLSESSTCSHLQFADIDCEHSLHSFDNLSRFLALTVSMGDWPKCLFLSCCLSVLIT